MFHESVFVSEFSCDECGKKYSQRDSLYCHKLRYCGKEPKFTCTIGGCLYKSHIQGNLRRHQITRHNRYA